MKSKRDLIILSVIIGLGIWVLDIFIDSILFFKGSFEDSLIPHIFGKAFYFHALLFISFVFSVLLISRYLGKFQKTEAKLIALENKYELQFNEALDGIIVCNAESGIITDCNKAIEKMFGRERVELIGEHQSILHPPNSIKDGFSKSYKQHMHDNEGDTLEEFIITKDGSIKTVAIKGNTFEFDGAKYIQGIFRDITDRKDAERNLQESEIKFKSITENATDCIFIKDIDRRYSFINQAMQDLIGLPANEVLGKRPEEIFGPEQGHIIKEVDDRTFSGENVNEIRALVLGDNKYFFNTLQSPLRMEHGKVTSIMGIVRDITELKLAEEALKKAGERLEEREKRLTLAVEGSNDGLWDLGISNNSSWVSSKFKEMLNYNDDDFNTPYEQWQNLLHPDDKEAVLEHLNAHLEKHSPYDIEYRLSTKQDGYRWFRARGQAVWDDNGSPTRMSGSLQDINELKRSRDALQEAHNTLETRVTERTAELEAKNVELTAEIKMRKMLEETLLESEERFRAAASCTADFIWEGHVQHDILNWTGDIDSCLGYETGEFPRTISGHMDSIHPEDKDLLLKSVEKSIASGEDFNASYRIRCKDGSYRYWNERGKAIGCKDGKAITWVGSVRDFTDKVLREEETKLVHSRLIHSNKMSSLGTIASGVAHEINNPNSYIMTNSQVLFKIWEDAVNIIQARYDKDNDLHVGGIPFPKLIHIAPKLILGVSEGSSRIKQIIDNLRNFSRPANVKLDEKVNVNNAILTSTAMIDSYIQKHTDNFKINCDDSIPCTKGNSQQLEQVIINLTMNALQSLKDTSGKVSISTSFDMKTDSIAVSIKDDGEGISADIINQIREPFFTTKLDRGGTGLGLSISTAIIKDHKGSMDFSSEEGTGTTVTVSLPVYS